MILIENDIVLSQAKTIWVGYSGGIDSSVLLHVLSQSENFKFKLKAVHINHQLQDAAKDFEQHCEAQAKSWNVCLKILYVQNKIQPGESLEAYARAERYKLFESCLEPGDVLVTSHHQEDQAETFLIQLVRGAGVEGLSAMGISSTLGQGILYRPFLNISKQELKNYASANKLSWIEDPSNLNINLERNFWRHEILPLLIQKHPSVIKIIARSARHCAGASELIKNYSQELLIKISGDLNNLNLLKLFEYSHAEQKAVLREWLLSFDLILSEQQLEIIRTEQSLVLNKIEIRKFKNYLYLIKNKNPQELWEIKWNGEGVLNLPHWPWGITQESFKKSGIDINKIDWSFLSLKNRRGGERILYSGALHHKTLKNIFQEKQIPPWLRDHLPLVSMGGELIGVILPEEGSTCLLKHPD